MDRNYQKFVERFTNTARQYGYEPVPGRKLTAEETAELEQHSKYIYDFLEQLNPGRKLTAEETAELEQHSKDVYDFLKQLRKFQKESKKTRILVRHGLDIKVA